MKSIDLQVNGYAGTDFNSPCSTEHIHAACEFLVEDEVEGILATIITNDISEMIKRIESIVKAREESELVRRICFGMHIEGPFISPEPGYVGAHDVRHVEPANLDDMNRLLEAGNGLIRIVTLAPECDRESRTTRWLTDQNVVVAAGHTNASLDQLKSGIDNGLSMFTHVGNACPLLLRRHDNIVQRALSLSKYLWCCFIADGIHIDFFALKNYLKSAGITRSIIVTDAIAAARLGAGTYKLGHWEVEVGPDLVARAPGGEHFVGSTVTMPRLRKNLEEKLELSRHEIEMLTFHNPRKALGIATV